MNEHTVPTLEPIATTLDRLRVTTVFGEPIREGHTTVVPVAEVRVIFGYGSGEGPDTNGAQPTARGGGGGLGARGVAQPRGYLHITADSVRFEPILHQGHIALATMFLAAWIVFWVSKTSREVQRQQHQPAWRVSA